MNPEYVKGVVHATLPLYGGYNSATVTIKEVNDKLAERRKELLPPTKKTMYVNIYRAPAFLPGQASRFVAGSEIFDTKEASAGCVSPKRRDVYVGTFPIEIEVNG